MILPSIDVAGAAGLIDSADAPPVVVFLSNREVRAAARRALEGRAGRRRLSWLALTREDDEPARFLERLAATLDAHRAIAELQGNPFASAAFPPVVPRIGSFLEGPAAEHAFEGLTRLLDELYAERLERSLVLSNYEVIKHAPVHRLIGFLLEFHPENLRIALFTAELPTLIGVPRLLVRQRAGFYLCER